MKPTLVIGGVESFVRQSIQPTLKQHGLELADIWSMNSNNSKSYRPIPKNVEVVVHLVDMSPCGHIHGTAWRQETERSGRIFIAARRKKAFLVPALERAGFPAQAAAPEIAPALVEPSPAEVVPVEPPAPEPELVMPEPVAAKPEKKRNYLLMPKRDKPKHLWEWYRFKGPEVANWSREIRKLAEASKYTQRDFADLIGINQSELSAFFRGTPRNEVVSEFTYQGYKLLGELLDFEMPELQRVSGPRSNATVQILKPTSDKPPAIPPAKEAPVKTPHQNLPLTMPEPTVPVHMTRSEVRRQETAPELAGVSRASLEDVLFDLVAERQLTKEGYRRLLEVLRG